jgi:hypothetical protein
MPITYEPIATNTLGSAAATVTFSTISGAYTDLVLVTNLKTTTTSQEVTVKINNDTGSNYSLTNLRGDGSTAASLRRSSQTVGNISKEISPNTAFEFLSVSTFMNYSNATTYKTWLSRNNRASASNAPGTEALVGLWRSTSAITELVIGLTGGNFDTGSTFTLYGIKAA